MAERKTRAAKTEESVKSGTAQAETEAAAPEAAPAASEPAQETPAAPREAPVEDPVRVDVTRQAAAPNAAAPNSYHQDDSVALLDEAGNELDVEDIFEYPSQERPGVLATVRQRVYRRFTHQGAKRPSTQLLYPAGARVSIFEAERIKTEHRRPTAEQAPEE